MIVGLDGPDDAAVWKIDDHRAIVITTDFFTPVVDSPYEYGSIAAANSLSDVYAMGGKPFLALNISAFPPDLPVEVLSDILRGGADVCKQVGVVVAGGHTVQDKEPKFGLVVLGFVDPQKMITKGGAIAGDKLYLTKKLGVGVLTTALKRGLLSESEISEVIKACSTVNDKSSKLAIDFNVRSGTDITGFGLLGHAMEIAKASNVKLRFEFSKIPFLTRATKLADDWVFPGGSSDNKIYFGNDVNFDESINEQQQMLLFDAQTSGGLLLAVPSQLCENFEDAANMIGQTVWHIGEVVEGQGIEVKNLGKK